MEIIGTAYAGPHRYGDFAWMISQPEYADALFIFNDNEGQFRAFRRDPGTGAGCGPGGGNAIVRPYRCQDPPRAAGIPTGDASGYPRLDEHARGVIDEAIALISDLAATGRYRHAFFSCDPEDPDLLGTGIFEVGGDVRRYIVEQLRALGDGA
jgi:hypothetical protein